MAQRDVVLEASGQFTAHRDAVRLTLWLLAAVALVAAAVWAVLNFDAIAAEANEYTGRRSGMRGLVAPALVGFPLFFAGYCVWLAFWHSKRWSDPATGERLKFLFSSAVFQVAAEAHEVHARLVTGDPRVYLPLRFGKKGEVGLTVHALPYQNRAFVSVTEGVGRKAKPLPLIRLEGNAARALIAIEGDEWRGPVPDHVLEVYFTGPGR